MKKHILSAIIVLTVGSMQANPLVTQGLNLLNKACMAYLLYKDTTSVYKSYQNPTKENLAKLHNAAAETATYSIATLGLSYLDKSPLTAAMSSRESLVTAGLAAGTLALGHLIEKGYIKSAATKQRELEEQQKKNSWRFWQSAKQSK